MFKAGKGQQQKLGYNFINTFLSSEPTVTSHVKGPPEHPKIQGSRCFHYKMRKVSLFFEHFSKEMLLLMILGNFMSYKENFQ